MVTRQSDNVYRLDHAVTKTQKNILNAFGLTDKNIEYRANWISEELKKSMMKQLINIHQQLLFKNFSQKSHLVILNVTVDTLVSLKQNHVVAMLPQWQLSNLFNFYQFC